MTDPSDRVTVCPGCRTPLRVPAGAVGTAVHCPHCQAGFRVTPGGEAVPLRSAFRLPRLLVVPTFALLMLGLAGTLVNGYLAALFALQPGADLEFARGRVREVRSARLMSEAGRPAQWGPMPHAAVGGVAAATLAADRQAEAEDEELARSWTPGLVPLHAVSTAVSAVVFLGGIAILRGRWFPLAVAGCVAAVLNVNHLCCLPGAVAGVWGILALARDEVRPHFRRR